MLRPQKPMEFGKRVGRRIRELRLHSRLSQAGLAERLGTDVAVGTVSRWERGSMVPPISSIQRIAEALDVDIDGFFAGILAARDLPEDPPAWAEIRGVLVGMTPKQLQHVRTLIGVYVEAIAPEGPARPAVG